MKTVQFSLSNEHKTKLIRRFFKFNNFDNCFNLLHKSASFAASIARHGTTDSSPSYSSAWNRLHTWLGKRPFHDAIYKPVLHFWGLSVRHKSFAREWKSPIQLCPSVESKRFWVWTGASDNSAGVDHRDSLLVLLRQLARPSLASFFRVLFFSDFSSSPHNSTTSGVLPGKTIKSQISQVLRRQKLNLLINNGLVNMETHRWKRSN